MDLTTKTLRNYQEKLVFNVCRSAEDVLVEQPTGSGKTVQIVTLVGMQWIVTQEVRRGIEAALGPRADNPAAINAENEADEPLDPEIRAEVELAMAGARQEIIDDGAEPTVAAVVRLTRYVRPDLPEGVIHRVAVETLAGQADANGAAVRDAIQPVIEARLRIDPMVRIAMVEAFAIVLEEFRDATLQESAVLQAVSRQIHDVTGGQMQAFARRLRDAAPRPLTEAKILEWADCFHDKYGEWPNLNSGPIDNAPGETWRVIHQALANGSRGLSGGSSLARFLAAYRGARNPKELPSLSEDQILAWADAHLGQTGSWPNINSGEVVESPGETWANIDASLRSGGRNLPGNSSLAQLLAAHRGSRHRLSLPRFSVEQILAWADAYFARTGDSPKGESIPIPEAPGETWKAVNMALIKGRRGLPGGSSLAQLLAIERGVRNSSDLSPLTLEQVLEWADAHHICTGEWPNGKMGAIHQVPGETWAGINSALQKGRRGLPGGLTLAQVLAEYRGVRNRKDLPDLTEARILEWADEHHDRTGDWPNVNSGPIVDQPGETWAAVNHALIRGSRGLPTNCSLADLLALRRDVRNVRNPPKFSEKQILAWAVAHKQRTGLWPGVRSGPIHECPDETWRRIDNALIHGLRGLSGGLSLTRLIQEYQARSHS
jgi:hypothetical protein